MMTSSDGLRVRCEARSVLYGLMIDRPKKKREREMDVRGEEGEEEAFPFPLFAVFDKLIFFSAPMDRVMLSKSTSTDRHSRFRALYPSRTALAPLLSLDREAAAAPKSNNNNIFCSSSNSNFGRIIFE